MITVYRFERPSDKIGPFKARYKSDYPESFYEATYEAACAHGALAVREDEDFAELRFAFTSREALDRVFSSYVQSVWRESGFRLAVFEIPESAVFAYGKDDNQVAFFDVRQIAL